jgi:hypothetical protein
MNNNLYFVRFTIYFNSEMHIPERVLRMVNLNRKKFVLFLIQKE